MRIPSILALLPLLAALAGCGDAFVADPSLQVEGSTVTSEPLGLSLELSDAWTLRDAEPGFDFVAIHDESRAVLTGEVRRTDPPEATLDEQIEAHLAQQRDHYGELKQVARRDTTLGALDARGVGYGTPRENGLVPVIVAMAHHGPYTVQFTCVGTAPARAACEQAMNTLVLPAP